MDNVNDIKQACDSIEERIYAINNILREKGSNEDVILELDSVLSIVKDIKNNVNESNATNTKSELLNIQKEIDALYEKMD